MNDVTEPAVEKDQLPSNPIELFETWLEDVRASNTVNPTAMSLSTVDSYGQPFQRMVLLKKYSNEGFVFFTNLSSRKANQIKQNNRVSLLFPWLVLERQVHVTGRTQALSRADVLKYFITRPRGSQLGAWVSKQSTPIESRHLLMAKFLEITQKFKDRDVSLPEFWGGFLVVPDSIEFWQSGEHRLHDRFLYSREKEDSDQWQISRLAP